MLAIRNGKVNTIVNGILEQGIILIDKGKILEIGEHITIPPEAEIIDAAGGYVMPGLIDCHTHLCLMSEPKTMPGLESETNEKSNPVTPYVRALDALNPFDYAIEKVRNAGFTTVYTGPGSVNVIGGMGISMKLRGITADEMAISGSEQMKMALGENPKRIYGMKQQSPVTRMGTAALIRKTLFQAKDYSEKLKKAENSHESRSELSGSKLSGPEFNFELEPLVKVVRGEMKVRFHCHRADDITTAIRLAEEFGLKYSLEHATDGTKIKDFLAQKDATVVVGPLLLEPNKQETLTINLETAGELERAGVKKLCLMADTASRTQWLPMEIGLLLRRGLSEAMAFRAVTINAAENLELQNRIGSIEKGKDADIAIFDGHPFHNTTLCRLTMIDGVVYHNTLMKTEEVK